MKEAYNQFEMTDERFIYDMNGKFLDLQTDDIYIQVTYAHFQTKVKFLKVTDYQKFIKILILIQSCQKNLGLLKK